MNTEPPTQPDALQSTTRKDLVETGGRLCQQIGLPRITGQIYGLLYLSTKPMSLDDIVDALSISKGSASTGTRQLLSWGAIKQTWIPGERKDHFEAVPDLALLIRQTYQNWIKPRIETSGNRLDTMTDRLNQELEDGVLTTEEHQLCQERLAELSKVQKRLSAFVPFAEKLL